MTPASGGGLLARLAVSALAAAAGWGAGGVLTLEHASAERIGVLPPVSVPGGLFALFALLLVFWYRGPLSPLIAASCVLLLPWLPVPVPTAFLIWIRPLALLLGGAAVLAVGLHSMRRVPAPLARVAHDPRRAPLLVAMLSVVLYGATAWRVAPFTPGGDEPHYLIITQSLLYDFDLRIENNHARGDYRQYFAGDLRPDFVVRGVDGEIYSIHMPGLPALVAPAFLAGGYAGAAAMIVLLSAAAGAVLWRLAFTVTGSAAASWFGWAAVSLSVPVVLHSFTQYPDSAGTLPILVGLYAILHAGDPAKLGPRAWAGCGAALAILPWLHSRFALLAAVLGAMIVLRLVRHPGGLRAAGWLLAVPSVSAVAWFGFFYAIYGSIDPRAQYGSLLETISSPAFIPGGIGGLLFDPQFGVLPYAPAMAAALAGAASLLVRGGVAPGGLPLRFLGVTLALLVVPYLLSTTTMRMWWGGASAPGRFLVALLPPLGIAAAVAWQRAVRPATRAVLLGALAMTIAVSAAVVWVDRGRLAFNARQMETLWLEWASPLAELSRAVPTFLRTAESQAWVHTAIWIGLLLVAWLGVRSADRGPLRGRAAIAVATAVAFTAAAMLASSIVWRMNGTTGRGEPVSSQVRWLTAAARTRDGVGVQFGPLRQAEPADLAARLTIEPPSRFASRRNHQVALLPGPIPAGEYAIEPSAARPAGRLSVGIGRTFYPIAELDLADGGAPLLLRVPVDVGALVVQGDADALETVAGVRIRPRALVPRGNRAGSELARQAIRYGRAIVYFLDDGSFPEPTAFWLGGGRDSIVVIQPGQPGTTPALRLRNAPVENRLRLETRFPRGWETELNMVPGEERQVSVPIDAARGVAVLRLEVSSGFRPSEHDPASRDERFLGVHVTVD